MALNPNAPVFVPAAFFAAEDFSPEWWRLVQTSPGFREFWLSERFVGGGGGDGDDDFLVEDLEEELGVDELDALEVDGDLGFVFDDGIGCVQDKAPFRGDDKTHFSLDSQALILKPDILDVLSPKKQQYQHSPVVRREKVPQLVMSNPKNSPIKRIIHQPR